VVRFGNISPIGLLLEALCDLKKYLVAQRNSDALCHFSIYCISLEIGGFKTWFVIGTLRFQKWFDEDGLDFQNEL
jgi:hypothetical protein